jgi:sugar phosphate isomerase/epimerase
MLNVSSLAWGAENESEGFAHLNALGVKGVELIPKRIDDCAATSKEAIDLYRDLLAHHSLSACAMQAIYYGSQGLHLLHDEDAFNRLVARTQEIARLADGLGVPVGVFGAPGVRNNTDLTAKEALDLGATRLHRLDKALAGFDFKLGLEPVPAFYNNHFLTTAEEIISVTEDIGATRMGLHLDIACVTLGGGDIVEDIQNYAARALHFHVAEPDLAGFSSPQMPHKTTADALQKSPYKGEVAIEMKSMGAHWKNDIETAVSYVRAVYL